jgi:hypothetical protein
MSYYESKIARMKKLGIEVKELGNEIAIIRGEFVAVGGDAPTMFELSEVTNGQARRLAELGRAVNGEEKYKNYLAKIGAKEVAWLDEHREEKEAPVAPEDGKKGKAMDEFKKLLHQHTQVSFACGEHRVPWEYAKFDARQRETEGALVEWVEKRIAELEAEITALVEEAAGPGL